MKKNRNVAFTICAKNRLPGALITKESFLAHTTDADFVIFLADFAIKEQDLLLFREANIIGFQELKSMSMFNQTNKLEEMSYKYNITEFNTAIKPFCIEYLMWNNYDKVLYFDPDIYFLRSCNDIYNIFLNEHECALTPHTLHPYPDDGKRLTDSDILAAGVYNLGFVGFKLTQEVVNFLGWWQRQLQDYCFHDQQNHMFVDQYWMGLAPSFINVYTIKNKGYNVAYWNLHERNILCKNDEWYANGDPIVFYHFSGLEYHNPMPISKYQNRFNLDNTKGLKPLFDEYIQKLKTKNAFATLSLPYYFNTDVFDKPLTEHDRRQNYQLACSKSQNPFLADRNNMIDTRYGLNIIGYFPYISGVGECARSFTRRLYSTGIPYAIHPIMVPNKPVLKPMEEYEYGIYYAENPGFDTSIFFVNLDSIGKVKGQTPQLHAKRNIGVFWWELQDELPYQAGFEEVEEVIVFTKYVEDIIRKFAPRQMVIHKMPYPYTIPKLNIFNSNSQICRKMINLTPDDFVCLYSFDYSSSYERKNPLALIEAFRLAFKDTANAKLILKTICAEQFPAESKRLEFAIKKAGLDEQVVTINGAMSRSDMLSLINLSDCYASLHRSEGLGIGILEAMALGKPVIATGYGGNTDFMQKDNSFTVKYKLVPIDMDIFNHYHKGSLWAEPDVDDAARLMLTLFKNKELCVYTGNNAREDIISYTNIYKYNKSIYNMLL